MKVTHPYSQRNLRNYTLTKKLKPFVGQNLSPKHFYNRYKQQKWTLKNFQANKFPNTTFSICLNLLQLSLSELSFVFALLFKPPSNFLRGYFNVSLSLVAVSSVWILIHFVAQLLADDIFFNAFLHWFHQDHLLSCSFKLVPCPNANCHVKTTRKDLEEHMTISCEWRMIPCNHCNQPHPECLFQVSHM